MASRACLADYLRSWQIDNFRIDGDRVWIGAHEWRATECMCGLPECDGWEVTPVEMALAPPPSATRH